MSGKKKPPVCIVTPDSGFREELTRELKTAGYAAAQKEPAKAAVVVLDARGGTMPQVEPILAQHAAKSILFTDHEDKDNINELLAKYDLRHLVGANGRAPIHELVTTIQKEHAGDVFGLAYYFGDTAKIESLTINDADQIKSTIEALISPLDLKASFAATNEFLTLTANELVTNAVYNAPVDESGTPKYEKTDRRIKVKLAGSETVEMAVCENEHDIGISVSDRFGRLTKDKIVRHLVKCVNNTAFIEEKKGGAGAGIYLAFHTASQFIINIDPGRRLEAICIVEKNKRYKDYRSRVTSFNYFTVEGRKVMGGAA